MDAATPLPTAMRDDALAIVSLSLGYEPALSARFADLGDLSTVMVLLALEEAFAIPLDVDDVWPAGTVADLLLLVQRRVLVGPRAQRQPGEQGCSLFAIAAYRAAEPTVALKMLPRAANDSGRRWAAVPARRPTAAHQLAPTPVADATPDRARRARFLVGYGLLFSLSAAAGAALVFWLAELATKAALH